MQPTMSDFEENIMYQIFLCDKARFMNYNSSSIFSYNYNKNFPLM